MQKKSAIQEELTEMGSRLANRENTNPFQTPEGYFDTPPDLLLAGIKEAAEATKPIVDRPVVAGWVKYAAAAVMIPLIGFAIFLFRSAGVSTPTQLSDTRISGSASAAFEAGGYDLSNDLEQLSILEMEPLLLADLVENPEQLARLEIDDLAVTDLLKELPDTVLQDYVEANPIAESFSKID